MNCPEFDKNVEFCSCKKEECNSHGKCCECLRKHLAINSLPSCCREVAAAVYKA